MKATIEIPDDLYRRVKAKSALEGVTVREVAVAFFSGWVGDPPAAPVAAPPAGAAATPAWFGMAKPYAAAVRRHDMASVRSSIDAGRLQAERRAEADTP